MTARRPTLGAALRRPTVIVAVAIALILLVFATKGSEIAVWSIVGLLGTAGYLYGTWIAIRMAGGYAARDVKTARLVFGLVLFLKVGPIVALALAAQSAPPACRDGLVYGAAMVYSWLVGWGLTPVEPAPTDDP